MITGINVLISIIWLLIMRKRIQKLESLPKNEWEIKEDDIKKLD